MRRLIPLALASALLATSCSSEASPTTTTTSLAPATTSTTTTTGTSLPPVDDRRPVLLDYSPTASDMGALVFLASHPDVRLVAVTLPGTGESYCEPGVAHTRGTLELLGLGDVPVACGPEDPITGWNAFPTSWRVKSSEIALPEAAPNEARTAPELIVDVVGGSDVPVELVAVGPLTNLAVALQADPSLSSRVGGITIMGGAVDVPGNVIRNEVAEWNIWVDPTAAGIVFASGAPVTLVPLDATNDVPSHQRFFDVLDAAAVTPSAEIVRDIIADEPFWFSDEFYFWDELAAAVLVDESIVEFETRRLVVDDEQRENKGWTREDPTGSEIRVAVSADRIGFEQLFMDTIIGAPTDLGYVEATGEEVTYFEALEEITLETSAGFDDIIEGVAADLGIDLGTEDAFVEAFPTAIPRVLAGPWMDRVEALETMAVPDGFEHHHAEWIEALRAVPDLEGALIEAFLDGDFEILDAVFETVEASCRPIQEAAELRLLEAMFDCF